MLCKKCGKNPCYERNGRVFALCASCSWKALQEFLDLPDPRSPTLRAPVLPAIELLIRIKEKVLTDENYDADLMVSEIDAVLKTAGGG